MAEENRLTVEVVFDDHDSYYLLTRQDIEEILAEPDLKKRDDMVIDRGVATTIGSSYDADLSIVIDSQPAMERWGDVEDDWWEALGVEDDDE